jgi:mRNA-degrading endonuclease RelE of RelBE toxin-antitoxin system
MQFQLLFSSRFKKSFTKLTEQEKKLFYKKLEIFINTSKKTPNFKDINNVVSGG